MNGLSVRRVGPESSAAVRLFLLRFCFGSTGSGCTCPASAGFASSCACAQSRDYVLSDVKQNLGRRREPGHAINWKAHDLGQDDVWNLIFYMHDKETELEMHTGVQKRLG